MKYVFLSHILRQKLPVYGQSVNLNIVSKRSLSQGDSSNVFEFNMENHWGTHMDMPYHFFAQGGKIEDLEAERCIYNSPQIIQVSLTPSEILECGDWTKDLHENCDILLFQSGWGERRDQVDYYKKNPGISPKVALFLRENFPNIRALGMDWISVSSFQNRELGREAHRAFLDPEGVHAPIALIEDMDLSKNLETLHCVFVSPFRLEKIDSAPCTILGGLYA